MTTWLIILGFALTGGVLLLHGFGKAKETSELILDTYRDLLDKPDDEEGAGKIRR